MWWSPGNGDPAGHQRLHPGLRRSGAARRLFRGPLPGRRSRHRQNGRFIGTVATSRDNTPDGTIVRTDEVISDYETISLANDVIINDIPPNGRRLVFDPASNLAQGQPICHFGVVTAESCGSVERVNNGWFTMNNGVVSRKGDSGGPSTC